MSLGSTELFEIDRINCIKMDLALNNLQRLLCHETQPIYQTDRKTTKVVNINWKKNSCLDISNYKRQDCAREDMSMFKKGKSKGGN